MIYNRTATDIEKAKKIIDTKVKKFQALSEEEENAVERGTITINTLNRIEDKQREVALLMNELGYYGFGIVNKKWQSGDVFCLMDYTRMIENLEVLKMAFFVYSTTPQKPRAKYHFETVNAIEKILVDLEQMMDEVKSNYRQCGTFQCGEE